MSTVVVNPLAGALQHYTEALAATVEVDVRLEVPEPSVAGTPRRSWLTRYVRALRAASKRAGRGGTVIVTWPVIGYLDVVLLALVVSRSVRTMLVVHDPEPLVHAVGLGRWARRLARLVRPTTLVVHSAEALRALDRHGLAHLAVALPHPILPACSREARPTPSASAPARPVSGAGRPARTAPSLQTGAPGDDWPVLRVVGQWKADRDVAMLRSLAAVLGDRYRLEVHGRGWPDIDGWHVRPAFVSEREFDELLVGSAAVLVPYRRFFQSGVAVRALEVGVPFVGPRVDALAGLTAEHDGLLVARPNRVIDWVRAIESAVSLDRRTLADRAAQVAAAASSAWTASVSGDAR